MKIGFGISERIVKVEAGGGGRFSALLYEYLRQKGHRITFDVHEPVDVFYDVANTTSVRRLKRIQSKGIPMLYRMDGLGGILEDRPVYLQKCALADAVVFQSKFCERCVHPFVRPKKPFIIYNGVPLRHDAKLEIKNPIQVLLYNRPQNAWGRQLGAQDWIQVLNTHQAEFGYNVTCVDKVNNLTRQGLHELMQKSDIFIHTSYYEACSNALLEAMSLGCAVICTDDSGNAELVGKSGCIVKTVPASRDIDYTSFTHKDCDFLPKIQMDRDSAYTQLKRCIDNLLEFKTYSINRTASKFDIRNKAQEYLDVMLQLTGQKTVEPKEYREYKDAQAKRFFGGEVLEVRGRLKQAYQLFSQFVDLNLAVLDIGTRDGWLVEYLKRKKYTDVLGLELTEAAVKYAQSRGRNVVVGDAHKVAEMFPPRKFGTVLMIHSLEHCYDPQLVINNVYKILKDQGILFVEVPLESEPKHDVAHFCSFPTIKDLIKLLGEHRFVLLKHKIVEVDPHQNINHMLAVFRKQS
jgi:glycosyltransferase involved in cell wall biosynthesis